jgi:hypothetical protein
METRCRVLRIEPPTPDSVERIVPGAVRAYEDRFAATIHGRLAPEVRARLDALLQPVSGQLDDGEDEPSTPGARALLNFVRGDPGRASLDSVMRELERLQTTDKGMIVRNDAGAEGLVAWRKIQALADGPVRLTYGYAMTVDTAQGSTATEHIHAMSAGSHAIHSFKAYTAASRHQRTTWMVVDEKREDIS